MSGYSFPNKKDDLYTRLIYTVSAEFIYRLDELLEEVHERQYGPVHAEMKDVVFECACVAVNMLDSISSASTKLDDMNFELFTRAPVGCTFHPVAESIIKASVKSLSLSQKAGALATPSSEAFKQKAQMLLTLGSEFFYELAGLCETIEPSEDGTLDDYDVTTLRSCIDAAMGMLYELKLVNISKSRQTVRPAVLARMADNANSYELECAGFAAVSAIAGVYKAVVKSASMRL